MLNFPAYLLLNSKTYLIKVSINMILKPLTIITDWKKCLSNSKYSNITPNNNPTNCVINE